MGDRSRQVANTGSRETGAPGLVRPAFVAQPAVAPLARAAGGAGHDFGRVAVHTGAAPIQRQPGDKDKPPSFLARLKQMLVPPTHTTTTTGGRKVSVGPTWPTWYGLNPHIGIKAHVSDEIGTGSGSTTLSSTGERFMGASVSGKVGKGTSDAVHEAWADHAKTQFDTVPEHFSTSFTQTSLANRGNADQSHAVEQELLKAKPEPTGTERANAYAYGHGGEKPVAGAKAKLKIGYQPETASYLGTDSPTRATYTARHPNPRTNLDLLKKFNFARRARGLGMLGGVLGGGAAMYLANLGMKKPPNDE